MRLQMMLVAATATLCAGAAQAATVEIKDAVARVTVIPENRTDIKIEVTRPNSQLPMTVRSFGDKTILDGDLDRRIRNCHTRGEGSWVEVRGVGKADWADMPQVVIRAPRSVVLHSNGAAYGSIGRSANLEIHNSGSSAVDMEGLFLTDDLANPVKFRIPDGVTIPAGGYLVFWAEEQTTLGPLHKNFKLCASGEQVGLFHTDGTTRIDEVVFGQQKPDVSYGRSPNGGSVWAALTTPTPGAGN